MKKVFAFQNFEGGGEGIGVAIAEDGMLLVSHYSSNATYAAHDLGATSDWHHDTYKAYYPDGFEVEFIKDKDVESHPGLQAALVSAEKMGFEVHPNASLFKATVEFA